MHADYYCIQLPSSHGQLLIEFLIVAAAAAAVVVVVQG